MKLRSAMAGLPARFHPGRRAYTLTEVMTAMSLFLLVVAAVLSSHLMGLRMFNITAAKLGASNCARKVLNRVQADVRSGKILYVGNGSSAGFTNLPLNVAHQGNSLKVCPTSDTNNYVWYFMDGANHQLKRAVKGATSAPEIVANYITNQVVFRAEDFAGNVLSDDQNNRVIRVTLEFYQWEFPVAQAGSGAFYDYYRLQTRVARRTID